MDKQKNLKKMIATPSVYSILFDQNGKKAIYSGVHFSLEEAVQEGVKYSRKGKNSKKDIRPVPVGWNILDGDKALDALTSPSQINVKQRTPAVLYNLDECKKAITNAQSVMMQLILKDGTPSILEENKPFLSKNAYKYIKDRVS